MTLSANLGFPRMGKHRELKKALESFWAGKTSEADLRATAKDLRSQAWTLQKEKGVDLIPSNDFALYDQILDAASLLGIVPEKYKSLPDSDLTRYFAMARGYQKDGHDLPALEMTKWFDTNYHYLVPDIEKNQSFSLHSRKPMDEYAEAKALGVKTRPVLIGPVSFLLLAKKDGKDLTTLVEKILPVYSDVLSQLKDADWVQIDEPCLVTDLSAEAKAAFKTVYTKIAALTSIPKIMLTTYFGALGDNLDLTCSLPVQGLHIDLVRAPEQALSVAHKLPKSSFLSLGVVDGRNIWRTDLDAALKTLTEVAEVRGKDKLIVAPSCSLLHSPADTQTETKLDPEFKSWLAFATEKLDEVASLAKALDAGHTKFPAFELSRAALASRKASSRVHNPAVKTRVKDLKDAMGKRKSAYGERRKAQSTLNLPLFPTTTIGSFPQTADVRSKRAAFKAGKIDKKVYDQFVAEQIQTAVKWQDDLGIDVLVHGEFERNDMVEYFGEQLDGFAFTENGWVQSYGSRCVKPPIIFGDVSRPKPMTV
ncbi:MAG: 5-methyltetrahydropteroyltriglutamate--homocysteine S-methyltransferase, partial [Proteobacteria bacterium]